MCLGDLGGDGVGKLGGMGGPIYCQFRPIRGRPQPLVVDHLASCLSGQSARPS